MKIKIEKLKCDCCGLCCRHIDRVPQLKNLDSGDGVYKNFDREKNLCKFIVNSPTCAMLKSVTKKYFSEIYTWKEFLQLNYKIYEQLRCGFYFEFCAENFQKIFKLLIATFVSNVLKSLQC